MSRAFLILANDTVRARAINWITKAPPGTRLTFQKPRRSVDQNNKFWAMATDIATQVEWHGLKLTPDDWKLILLDALKRELRVVPTIDGRGFVNLGRSSSDLSKEEMSDLIELMYAFGTERGVRWSEPEPEAHPAPLKRAA
jgi:hypothetical protein